LQGEISLRSVVYFNEEICDYNVTALASFLNGTKLAIEEYGCVDDVDILSCVATIVSYCDQPLTVSSGSSRRLQQTSKIDFIIVYTFVCNVAGCTSEQDTSNAYYVADIASNALSFAVQSGDLVLSLLRNPNIVEIDDCLVAWGRAGSPRSASVSTDKGPVTAIDARFYPVSPCELILFFFSEVILSYN